MGNNPSTTTKTWDEMFEIALAKLFAETFQIALNFGTILINLYCLFRIFASKDLRKRDYFLVGLQTVNDLIFSGLVGTLQSSVEVKILVTEFCADINGYLASA
ncbi:uncharacterized protein LOC142346040 [Convolutriloba macropyga]|uniref:uncharacterized protein LOC142346040 n=1 Tax=Convolutriloba macropyga TaxID=536237 RepID=UPI003F526405